MSALEDSRAASAAAADALGQLKDELILGDGLANRSERLDAINEWFGMHKLPPPTAAQIAAERARRLRPVVRQQSKDNLAAYQRRRAAANPQQHAPEGPPAA